MRLFLLVLLTVATLVTAEDATEELSQLKSQNSELRAKVDGMRPVYDVQTELGESVKSPSNLGRSAATLLRR